jgi:uncharacterized protein (DUF1330 family)
MGGQPNIDAMYDTQQFQGWYGDGANGAAPTKEQWDRVLALPPGDPITLINFFKLNERAVYLKGSENAAKEIRGEEAFNSYAEVSIPTMQGAGGEFLHVGPSAGNFLGSDEEWDVIAIGRYPNLRALISLYADENYRGVFHHRVAACARQKVLIAVNT